MKVFLPILFTILTGVAILSGCAKETDFEAIDLGYDYFPNTEGTFIEYEVDSINYGIEVDTVHFYLKEVIAEEFIDDEGNLATRIERFKKFNMDDEYVLTDVWVQKRTSTTAERIEENFRYVRLAFPVEAGEVWDGNAYNIEEAWDYTYTSIGGSYNNGVLPFSNTLRVRQRENINLVDQESAWEVYARGIGLVHKKLTDLNYQFFEITGVDMEMRAIAFGTVE
ncbi:hypothetical protein [Sanyastnella coralliicola]|uniref:hypothetical protein n=1 Tax=Sanyastnella coralliicola TaxID=3069118 RepID=UPI0027B8BA1B|nr:hypothetical protein [Longitalea sp. SCSIO 12813]